MTVVAGRTGRAGFRVGRPCILAKSALVYVARDEMDTMHGGGDLGLKGAL
jgi:hypothetical protein